MNAHVIRWFGRTTPCAEYPDGLVPRNRHMNGRDWGWDAKCSCGWESRTGGATEASVRRSVEDHRWTVDPDGEVRRSRERRARRMASVRARIAARRASVGIVR